MVAGGAELPVFLTPDFIHRVVEVFDDMEFVEDDGGLRYGLLHRPNVGGPHIHGDCQNAASAAFG